jgi:hypothetical protein
MATTTSTSGIEPTILWLTDNSRRDDGLDRCARARLLGYHWGPTGYGIQKKGQSIPLATGIYLHKPAGHIYEWVMAHDQLPPDEVVREAVSLALTEYDRVITLRGLRNLDESERLDTIILEQKALIEGLIWADVLTFLPWFHSQCRVVSVEHEEILVCGCTCGLGEGIGEIADHEHRGCEGIGYQSKPDLVGDYRARPGVYSYWERKTASQTGERFETEWETKAQFTAGALGAARRLDIPISEAFVIAYIKGRRSGEYNWETKRNDGPLMQQSPLCYGFRRPSNPPLEQADWQASYDYVGEDGKNHRLGKAYQKALIWQLAEDVPEVRASGISVPEFWAKWIPREKLAQQMALVGPLQISTVLQHDLVEELVAEETRWKGIVWELYQVWAEIAPAYVGREQLAWTDPQYQAALRRLVPRNFSGCRRYGKRHECQFGDICHYREGWQDPLGSGNYIPRKPHHEPELRQMESRGLVAEGGWADEQEDE